MYLLTGTDEEIADGYIYLRYYNLVDGKIVAPKAGIHDTAEYQYKWEKKNQVYANGGSEIYE